MYVPRWESALFFVLVVHQAKAKSVCVCESGNSVMDGMPMYEYRMIPFQVLCRYTKGGDSATSTGNQRVSKFTSCTSLDPAEMRRHVRHEKKF